MRTVWMLLLSAVTAFGALSLASCGGAPEEEGAHGVRDGKVRIGLFVSTSGDISTYGRDTRNAVNIAVEEINAAGGVLGKPIEIVFHDTASRPDDGATVAERLTSRDRVLVGIGAVASGISLTAAPVFQREGVPMVTPSSTNPEVTRGRDMVFRICYMDSFQGAALATFAYNDLGARRAAMIVKRGDPYSDGLARFFREKFEAEGGTVERFDYSDGTADFSNQITGAAGFNPDVLFCPVYYNDMSQIARQVRARELDVPMLGGDGWESPQLVEQAAGALEGSYFGNHYNPQDEREKVQNFIRTYEERHGARPSSLAALGYDAVYVVAQAIERAGEFDRAKVAEALRATRDFEGVTGTFMLDANRNARKPISILRIEGNEFKPVRQITPAEVE
jgi:branched-chain amino acid transport system substrate-binding protein